MLSIFANDGGITLERVTGSGNTSIQTGQIGFSTSVDTLEPAIYVLNAGSITFQVTKAGIIVTNANAAPADGILNAGQMALWFDKTNGAAKLMVKAKQANGTVVTGQVALA
jgi:hypothetical protein